MKKIISLFLSAVMIFSCFSVVSLAGKLPDDDDDGGFHFDLGELVSDKMNETGFKDALENLNLSNIQIPGDPDDLEELLTSGALNDVNFLGLTVDFLYNNTDDLMWSTVSMDRNDIAIARGSLNTYLMRVFNRRFLGDKFYTSKNATAICNFVGHLFFPNYEDKEINFKFDKAENNVEFYTKIANESGLSDLISHNWCPFLTRGCNYKPLLYVLGVNFNDFPVPDRDIYNGEIVARILIESVIKKTLDIGPINYLLDVIWAFSRTYNVSMITPVEALFNVKLEAGVITKEELSTFKGLFNLIANSNNPDDITKLQFITPPSARFAIAKDTTELFLYVLIYLNLVGRYKNNARVIGGLEEKVSASSVFSDKEKSRINMIIDALFLGNASGVIELFPTLIYEEFDEYDSSIWIRLREYLASILKSFAGILDRIYKSLKDAFDLNR